MIEQNSQRPDSLEQRLGAQRLERAPDRDLWPGIAARLEPRMIAPTRQATPSRAMRWLPVGAALAAGYVGASLFPLPWSLTTQPAATPMATPVPLLTSVQPALSQLPPKTRAVVEVDLSGLEQDQRSIDQALAGDPDNPLLQELRLSAQDRALSVVERMNRLTRFEPPEDVEI